MNYFDIIPGLVMLLFTLLCYQKGFIKSLLMIAVWGGAVCLAVIFYPGMASWLTLNFSVQPQWLNPLAFAVLFLMVALIFYVISIAISKRVPAKVHSSTMNKIPGILPGLVLGWCAALLITKAAAASTAPGFSAQVKKSFFASRSGSSAAWLQAPFSAIFTTPINEKIAAAQEEETAVAGTEQFKNSNYIPRPDLEQQMLQLVNAERLKLALKPLQADSKMREVAVLHAADMFVRGYFSHNSPEGIDPFMRMKQSGIRYRTAGENLAHAASLPLAHTGLMNSTGHRENILNPRFGRVGIAILDAGKKGLMFVQEFRD